MYIGDCSHLRAYSNQAYFFSLTDASLLWSIFVTGMAAWYVIDAYGCKALSEAVLLAIGPGSLQKIQLTCDFLEKSGSSEPQLRYKSCMHKNCWPLFILDSSNKLTELKKGMCLAIGFNFAERQIKHERSTMYQSRRNMDGWSFHPIYECVLCT